MDDDRYFDPVSRAWAAAGAVTEEQRRRATAPSPSPTEQRLSDTEWGRALETRIMSVIEQRLAAEREHVLALLAEVVAGEPGQAHEGFAEDLRQLRAAIGEVSRSLAAFAEADRRSKEAAAVVDLPALPLRRALN
jgi:hypothetical protein